MRIIVGAAAHGAESTFGGPRIPQHAERRCCMLKKINPVTELCDWFYFRKDVTRRDEWGGELYRFGFWILALYAAWPYIWILAWQIFELLPIVALLMLAAHLQRMTK